MYCTLAVKADTTMVSQDPLLSMVPGVFGCNIGDVASTFLVVHDPV